VEISFEELLSTLSLIERNLLSIVTNPQGEGVGKGKEGKVQEIIHRKNKKSIRCKGSLVNVVLGEDIKLN